MILQAPEDRSSLLCQASVFFNDLSFDQKNLFI